MIIVDHFCGAGGESTGILQAAAELNMNIELHAHNHWSTAIETHTANHPDAIHRQAAIEDLNPMECVKGQRVGLMWASPECTHHSVARGGRPCEDQSRSTAMHIIKWAQELYIDRIIVENVPEFLSWGPLGANGKPMESKKGATFKAWVGMLESLGYTVEHRILRAADYGDPTTRRRLFVQAVRGRKKIVWPEPTHSQKPDLFGSAPWVPARDIIDWDYPSQSIFERKRPLAPATLKRIEAGIERYWGEMATPFLAILRGTSSTRSIDLPIPALTAGGGHLALIEPFLSKFHGGNPNRNHLLSEPVPTIDCANRVGLVEPLLMQYYGNGVTTLITDPVPTVTCKERFALVEPTYNLDIRFRMLQPHELAAAQGFPKDYWFAGTKSDQVRQIGNAVCCGVARALAKVTLEN